MKKQYIVSSVLVVAVLLSGTSVFAKEGSGFSLRNLFGRIGDVKAARVEKSVSPRPSVSKSPRPTPSTVNLACVGTAVNARESALSSGAGKFSDTVKTAYSVRASALAAAFAKTTAADVRAANQAAWTQFNTSVKTAGREWKATQKSAWATFRTSIKACGGSAEVSDESHSSTELSGD